VSGVPRETWLADPESAALAARYAAVPGLAAFAQVLAGRGVERGLIGPREVPRLWPRHLANCAVVAQEARIEIPPGATVADVGSGAGLPGLVWALVRPDLHVTLIEPLLRRATFLSEVVDELDLGSRVAVVRARAEHVPGGFDVVTARAVARMPQLVGWTLPLTRVGGWLVALKGVGAGAELGEAADRIRALGGGDARIAEYGTSVLGAPTTAVLVRRVSITATGRQGGRMGRA
jgi:16S rRNA (guanine527-N7)-methyltransferase